MTDTPKPLSREEVAQLKAECPMRPISYNFPWNKIGSLIATIEAQQEQIERLRSAVNSIKHIAGRDGPASEFEACGLIDTLATEALSQTEQT